MSLASFWNYFKRFSMHWIRFELQIRFSDGLRKVWYFLRFPEKGLGLPKTLKAPGHFWSPSFMTVVLELFISRKKFRNFNAQRIFHQCIRLSRRVFFSWVSSFIFYPTSPRLNGFSRLFSRRIRQCLDKYREKEDWIRNPPLRCSRTQTEAALPKDITFSNFHRLCSLQIAKNWDCEYLNSWARCFKITKQSSDIAGTEWEFFEPFRSRN